MSDSPSVLTRLVQHLAWADDSARRSLDAMPVGSPEAERARTIFAHVAGAEHVWLSRLEGRASTHAVWPELDVATAAALASRTAAELAAFVARLSPDDGAREVTYTNSAGRTFHSRVDDVLTHVALHGTYHRGQIAMLVRQGGGEPASTDYIAFVRGAPAAKWTERNAGAGSS